MSPANIVALLTGLAGIVTAAGGILLAVRAVRDKERRAAKEEINTLQLLLDDERKQRIDSELATHRLKLRLAQHGLNPDET